MGELSYTVGGDSNLVSFKSAARVPITSLKAHFKPKQDLHGYSKPWPAGGGNNIWDEEWEVGRFNTTTGENIETTNQIRSKNYIPTTPGNTYYVVAGASTYIWVICYDENQQVTGNIPTGGYNTNGNSFGVGGGNYNKTFTAPSDCYYIRFYTQQSYGGTYLNDIAINKDSTVTTYSPYENICPIEGWTEIKETHTGKNIGKIIGYSAVNVNSSLLSSRKLTNSYGTVINKIEYNGSDTTLVITQSEYPENSLISYKNGYFAIVMDENSLTFGQRYDVSFKVTNIINNPLNVSSINNL